MSFLQGPPNPKTLVPVIIPPRLFDFEAWRDSSRAPDNRVNEASKVTYTEASGYDTTPTTSLKFENDLPEMPSKLLSNMNPLYIQALAGPNSWTYQEPSTLNSNIGLVEQSQIGFQTKFGANGGDYQIFVQSQTPLIQQEQNPLDDDIRQQVMSNYRFSPPNYISRNNLNLDYGVNGSTNELKLLAQNKFITDSNAQRSSIQNSAMRKRNSEMWQSRLAPISNWKN